MTLLNPIVVGAAFDVRPDLVTPLSPESDAYKPVWGLAKTNPTSVSMFANLIEYMRFNSDGTITPQNGATFSGWPATGSTFASPIFTGVTTLNSGQVVKGRVVVAAGAITVTSVDYFIGVNKTVGAATTVNLPANPTTWTTFVIKDLKGDAGTNPITIAPAAGTIDGQSTYIMNVNRESATIVYSGSEWSLI